MKKMFFFFFFISISYFTYASAIDFFIKDCEDYLDHPEKIQFDYSSPKWKRSQENQFEIQMYSAKIGLTRGSIPHVLAYFLNPSKKDELENNVRNFTPIRPDKVIQKFKALKNSGIDFQDGDIVVISSCSIYSAAFQKYIRLPYGHSGVIHIQNQKPFVFQMNRRSDLLVTSLFDFLFPLDQPNFEMGIFRCTQKIDRLELKYLLDTIYKNRHNLISDEYLVTNKPIHHPEQYFSKKQFISCIELPYLIYEYILQRNDFVDDFRIDFEHIVDQVMPDNSLINPFLKLIDQTKDKRNVMLFPAHFTQSKDFKALIEIKTS